MQFYVVTVFPFIFESPLRETILKRAQEKALVSVSVVELREFAENKHLQLDDYPYGGGPGMIMKPDPIFRAFESLPVTKGAERTRFIYLSPQGKTLTQEKLRELTELESIVLLCGRYKGIDQRVIDTWIDEEISVGDYILSGGEIPALMVIDGVSRLLPGVLGNAESADTDSFENGLLDYPAYTRPAEWRGQKVPEVLLNGNHKEIDEWRRKQSLKKTAERRADLLEKYRAQTEENKDE